MTDEPCNVPKNSPRLKLHDPKRPPRPDRIHYGPQHQRLRKQRLELFPLCELQLDGCTGWSQEADHLVYPAKTIEDYQALCRHCHRAVTVARRKRSQ